MAISRSTTTSSIIHRNLIVNRIQRRYGDARYLWWWGKHGRAWWSSQVEDVEERMRRHQTIMMHRYSKALRRKAMWEREDSPPSWAWRLPGRLRGVRMDRKAMSSTEQMQAKMEEHEKGNNTRRPWEEFHQDFESFKAAVDKAIERDPYGTLFGRRLRSPPSNNNSSWTSWSWIFNPKEIKEDALPENSKRNENNATNIQNAKKGDTESEQAVNEAKSASTVQTVPSNKTETTVQHQSKQDVSDGNVLKSKEYIYDPISGRNIANQQQTSYQQNFSDTATTNNKSESGTPRKSIFHTLFSEHGVDIPVKTYKPPKVYGYTGGKQTDGDSIKSSKATSSETSKGFESSRKREYQQLRAATIGNHIDTTAEFGGKYETEAEKAAKVEQPPEKKARISSAPDDDAPLFSGTTYASKASANEAPGSAPNSQWLVKEGFKTGTGFTIPSLQSDEPFRGPVRESSMKLESALDRTNARSHEIPVKLFGTKLQPSIDRITSRSREEIKKVKQEATAATSILRKDLSIDKREDVDLLRASDVRAAAKMARLTKQQKEAGKQERRAELEKDFVARHENDELLESTSQPLSLTTERLTRSLTNVWKHMKQYPQGIVAKTMQTMGLTNTESWKNYVRPNSRSEELIKPLEFKDESLSSSPSIYKKAESIPRLKASVPTAETIAFEENIQKRAKDLQLAAKEAVEASKATDEQITSLARDIKTLYEAEHGEITIKHRQTTNYSDNKPILSIRNPTVKPGVIRDLQMERHIGVFEPKFADLVDKAKNVKRGLHEVSLSIGDIENERTIASIAAREASLAVKAQAIKAQMVDSTKPKQENSIIKDAAPVQTSVAFDSPYILLSFNTGLGEVQLTPLRSLMGTTAASGERVNPIAVISSLKNANAFVKHFADLDKHGYELSNGAGDVLFFRKKDLKTPSASMASRRPEHINNVSVSSSSELRRTIAAAEAAAQPKTDVSKTSTLKQGDKNAATVLDKIPADVPTPGPAAPTAPPSISTGIGSGLAGPSNRQKGSNKIRRQEEVFSGQRRSQPASPSLQQPEAEQSSSSSGPEQLNIFGRIRRLIRRTMLTALAFGGGAYAIGVVTEALGAQAQIEDGQITGPRTKVVLPTQAASTPTQGQRPGIFSTESSR